MRGPEPRSRFHPEGQHNGYLTTFGDFTVYVAGDTECVPEMADLGEVGVPINLPYTMPPEGAVGCIKIISPGGLRLYNKLRVSPRLFIQAQSPEAYTQPMSDINGKIRDAIKSALISQNKTTQQLAQEMGVERSQIDRLASGPGLEGPVPKPLLEVLDALGLELLVHPKEQKEQTLSSMLQDNARS